MSTEIFYDKQFIRAEKLFVPMLLAGSNNCYQYDKSGRGRREHVWSNDSYITEGKRAATRDEILAKVESIRDEYRARYTGGKDESGYERDTYDDKRFGNFASLAIGGYSSRTTFGMYKSFYKTGMDKALTVEQLKDENVDVYIQPYDYEGKYKAKAEAAGVPWLGTVNITNTAHLLATINLFNETYKNTNFSWHICFDEYDLEDRMKIIRQRYFPAAKNKNSYETIQVESYFTVLAPNGYYFLKRTKRGYKYSPYPQRKFQTEKEAKDIVNRMKNKLALKTELVNERAWIKVVKKVANNLVE